MIGIKRTLPIKTRLPIAAWLVAGLVTLFSTVSGLEHYIASGGATAMAKYAQQASVTDLLDFLSLLRRA
jgi:hypothetical protein